MLGNVVEQLSSISSLDEKMQTLESKIKDLSCREADVIAMLQDAEFRTGKKRKRQVDNWLDNVQKKKNEFQSFERDVQGSNVLQKLRLGKRAEKMIGEVVQLVKEGRFPEGLLLDVHDSKQVPLLTEKLIGQEFKRNLKKIQDCLKKDDILRIGIYGMAGAGKTTLATHIHNILLKRSRICNHVYWVTVSQGYSIHQLQNDIARMVKLDLSKENDEKRRAAKLFQAITRMKKTVLILDDVWEHFSLVKVGIPCRVNGCKLILTTRSLEVCRKMECQEKIKVGTLSEEEAWNLFMEKLGHGFTLPPEEKEIAMSVAKRCGGLPLGIITMAGSMREVNDIREWRNLLEELKESMKRQQDMEAEVFPILKLSYSRLKDEKLQLCFLYCALFPEDYRIERENQLIPKFIVEELIDGRKNRQAQFDMCHTLLNKLENACLLESCENKFDRRSVKMHDLMREMALKITRESPRFMVKAGLQLREIPEEQEWSQDLEKVSLMYNNIEEILDGTSPRCPKLSTLLLQKNSKLRRISNSFFAHMCGLRVLDLSQTAIVDLPGSISDLENLTALLLRFCVELRHVPPLGKLRALQVLNLSGTRIEEIPQGMEMLVNLKCLYMEYMKDMEMFPTGKLSSLSCLQVLRLDSFSPGLHIEEVEQLGHLEEFEGRLYGMRDFKKFIASGRYRQLSICCLQVGEFKSTHSFYPHDKEVKIGNRRIVNGKEDGFSLLPPDIQYLNIEGCDGVVCPSFINARGLKECRLSRCDGIECFLSLSSDEVVPLIKSIQVLDLDKLQNLSALIKWEGPTFSTPHGTLFSLECLFISDCHKIKKLLPPGMLQHYLPNLILISVHNCYQVEEIIGDDGEELDTGHNSSSSNNSTIFTLPKLKEFALEGLPELKSICRGVMACDSLEFIGIRECTKLKRIPFSLPLVNGQLSAPTTLRSIQILDDEELWWESLEWEHPDAKDVLRPLLELCQFGCY